MCGPGNTPGPCTESTVIRRLAAIQKALQDARVDGWLLYDFHGINPIARRVVQWPQGVILTRRWACFIPAQGTPRWLIHHIEQGGVPLEAPLTYITWQNWVQGLRRLLAEARRVAMEISPGAAIPAVSRVDAGTVELVRSLGVDVVSSADLVQVAEAVWSPEQKESHLRAARHLLAIKDIAFAYVRERLHSRTPPTELEVQALIVRLFRENELVTDHPPIVAVDEHAANPHYVPNPRDDRPIREDTLLLVDLWAKEAKPDAVYADITWMAYTGDRIPPRVQQVFDVVRMARDAVLTLARERLHAGLAIRGYELDDRAREVIARAGLAEYFTHRTGHSLGVDVHGNGVNLDNLESHDYRLLIPGIGFTVEPGVYIPEEGIGIRLETDCFVRQGDLEITTLPLQEALVRLK